MFRLLLALVFLSACGSRAVDFETTEPDAQEATAAHTMIGAMYHNWYTPTRWQSKGPYTPELGLYDTADPEVARQHVQWARRAGINTFVIDTWINDTDGGWMDRNTPPMLDVFDAESMPYFFIADGWFRYTGNDPGGYSAHDIAHFTVKNLGNYFSRPGYVRIDNKPVVFFWATDSTSCELWDAVRSGIEGQLGPIFMTGFNNDAWCWDRFVRYNSYNPNYSTTSGQLDAMADLWSFFENKGHPWSITVFPGYDDTHIRPGHPPIPLDPDFFRASLRQSFGRDQHAATSRWLFVCSFNEWYEASVIEPTQDFEQSGIFLDIMRQELERAGWIDDSPDPDPDPDPVCDPTTQPAPHWGERDGLCLRSCGGLGGSECAASSCSAGLVQTSERAHDCDVCCRPADAPPPDDPPPDDPPPDDPPPDDPPPDDPPTVDPQQACNAHKVARGYRGILGRGTDCHGLEHHADLLDAGTPTVVFTAGLFDSPEFAANRSHLTGKELARELYLGILEREPEPAGLASTADAIDNGLRNEVAANMLDGGEFLQNVCGWLQGQGCGAPSLPQCR